jgi:hypothetical protein
MHSRERWKGVGAFAVCAIAMGIWQYTKYVNGHGIFYQLNPVHGDIVLVVSHVVVFLCVAGWFWRAQRSEQ